jgi:hypothetical protein
MISLIHKSQFLSHSSEFGGNSKIACFGSFLTLSYTLFSRRIDGTWPSGLPNVDTPLLRVVDGRTDGDPMLQNYG